MKIGLISRGRTISTAIMLSLSLDHGLTNFGEKYFTVLKTSVKINSIKKKFVPLTKFKTFKNQFSIYTNQLFTTDNFICKLWPSMLIYRDEYHQEVTIDHVLNNIIFNISYYWNLQSYDRLFFLDRDLKLSTYSWVYSKHVKKFHSYKNENVNAQEIIITDKDINNAKFYILEYCLQQRIKNCLLSKNYNLVEIYEPSNLINQDKLQIVKTNLDYRRLIKNNQILDELLIEYFEYCQKSVTDWVFY